MLAAALQMLRRVAQASQRQNTTLDLERLTRTANDLSGALSKFEDTKRHIGTVEKALERLRTSTIELESELRKRVANILGLLA